AASMPTPQAVEGLTVIAIDGKTLRGSFDAFNDRKAVHMMSALRAGSDSLNSAPRKLSGFLPGYAECGVVRF
ncbi:MAG: hypothetical protein WCE20_06110, partial [Rhizomicrobium sp.]